MVEICAFKTDLISENDFNNFDFSCISDSRYSRIKRYKFLKDKKACFFSEKIIQYYMKKNYGIRSLNIIVEANGKPVLENKVVDFNISHSEDWVVCAFSDHNIGIDIEKINKCDFLLAKKYYNIKEYEKIIGSKNEKDVQNLFFQLWTLKESFLKNTGSGIKKLSSDLMFEVSDSPVGRYNGELIEKVFYSCQFDDNYYLAVCADDLSWNPKNLTINLLTVDDLLVY